MNFEDTIKLYIPKELIVSEDEHPEEYGQLIVVLKNDMWTDVYTDKDGNFYSITNNVDLIKYVHDYLKKWTILKWGIKFSGEVKE